MKRNKAKRMLYRGYSTHLKKRKKRNTKNSVFFGFLLVVQMVQCEG